jgi:hypothetical protein
MAKKIKYTEPTGYFPESVRKKYGLGEYAKEEPAKKTEKKTPEKKADTKKK